jgi:hypothetical protein
MTLLLIDLYKLLASQTDTHKKREKTTNIGIKEEIPIYILQALKG